MPRRPRIIVPGTPVHLIQRGNNRQACFYTEEDCLYYLTGCRNMPGVPGVRYMPMSL